MSEGTKLYTLTQESRQLESYEWKVEEVLYDDATVEKLMEQANTYYIKEYHRDHYESYYDNKETFRVNIVPEILLVDNGQLIGFYFAKADDIDGKCLLLTEVEGGRITLRYECTSHGDSDSGKEEYVYIFTMEYAKSHNFEM